MQRPTAFLLLVVVLAALAGTLALPSARFDEPSNRVFQQTGGAADILLRWTGAADQVRLTGEGYSAASPDGQFEGVVAGWYTARLYRNGFPGTAINIGVGDVYAVAGQSNSVSQVQPEGWKPATIEPQRVILSEYYRPGFRDPGRRPLERYLYDAGVAWQYAGAALNRPYPIMFVMVGLGNTSTQRWAQPDTYQRIIDAVETYEPKAILWHQGESDSTVPPLPADTSFANMRALIEGVGGSTPWVMAINSTSSAPPEGFVQWPVREAQRRVIDAYPHVLQGPDTDTVRIAGEVEYMGLSLQDHGEIWAATLTGLGL